MPVAPKAPAPAPKMSKTEREALKRQERAQQQMATLEANARRLDALKAWAVERLMGLLGYDDAAAAQAATRLQTLNDEELKRWEAAFFRPTVGFAEEYIQQRASLQIQTLSVPRKEEGDQRKAALATAHKRERQQERQRDAIYHTGETDASASESSGSEAPKEKETGQPRPRPTRSGSPAPSTASAASAGAKKRNNKIGGIQDIQKMDVLIPGVAKACDCEARRHRLLQNCLNCGKIVCEQEGRGPCFFCGIPLGSQPLSAIQIKESLDKGDLAEFERKRLLDLQRALAQRDRLLHYEQTKAKRTTVIDDQVDYFESTSNQWLTVEERLEAARRESETLEAKEAAQKRGGAYTVELDLQRGLASMTEKPKGPSIAESQAARDAAIQKEEARWDPSLQLEMAQKLLGAEGPPEAVAVDGELDAPEDEGEGLEGHLFISDAYRAVLVGDVTPVVPEEDEDDKEYQRRVRNPRVMPHPKLQQAIPFTPETPASGGPTRAKKAPKAEPPGDGTKEEVVRKAKQGHVQNDYWAEDEQVYKVTRAPKTQPWVYVTSPVAKAWPRTEDRGMCLSMHQPWASLLVHGIKKHEGRSWPTDHRGRLWIHAAAHEPATHDVRAVENFFRGRGCTRFPTHYPTSVLLGRVDVTDCLHTDDYKIVVPAADQESESDYVFICVHAALLVVPLRMEGKHKIYALDKKIWTAAKTQAGE